MAGKYTVRPQWRPYEFLGYDSSTFIKKLDYLYSKIHDIRACCFNDGWIVNNLIARPYRVSLKQEQSSIYYYAWLHTFHHFQFWESSIDSLLISTWRWNTPSFVIAPVSELSLTNRIRIIFIQILWTELHCDAFIFHFLGIAVTSWHDCRLTGVWSLARCW